MTMYSLLICAETLLVCCCEVTVRDSSESGWPLADIVKLLYHPNGALLTSWPLSDNLTSRIFSVAIAGSLLAKSVERWA